MAGRQWEPQEIEFIEDNYLSMTCQELAELLPSRTRRAVEHKINQLGLVRPSPQVGDKINRLTILELYSVNIGSQNRTYAKVQCECGKIKPKIVVSAMVAGTTKSCSCWKAEKAAQSCKRRTTHGMSNSRLYQKWAGMLQRCNLKSSPQWDDYGGRGISVCDEWQNSFENFRDWAIKNGWDESLPRNDQSLERKNVNDKYCPTNCKFATMKEQANNKRTNVFLTVFCETKTMKQWSEDSRCIPSYNALRDRIQLLGWDAERAITTPLVKYDTLSAEEHKKRNRARNNFNLAIGAGTIQRGTSCSIQGCTNTNLEAHHHLGYDKSNWFNVQWLCVQHHRQIEKLRLAS